MRRISTALLVTGTLLTVPSTAAAVVPPDTRYAGGDVADKPPGRDFPGRAGDNVVTLRTIGTGQVQAGATVLHACGREVGQAIGSDTAAIAPDGAFTVQARSTDRVGRTRVVTRVTISGTIDGNRATGTVVSSTSVRGRRICRGSAPFTSITPPQVSETPAAAPGGAVLRGGLNVSSFSPYEVAFRVAPDGASVSRFLFGAPWRCNGRSGALSFYERGAGIGPDGTFRIVNPYQIRSGGTVERGRVVITGRFVEGGASGTIEASSRTTRRGRTISRCVSGSRTWTAAV
jgi:hypothetical protein